MVYVVAMIGVEEEEGGGLFWWGVVAIMEVEEGVREVLSC